MNYRLSFRPASISTSTQIRPWSGTRPISKTLWKATLYSHSWVNCLHTPIVNKDISVQIPWLPWTGLLHHPVPEWGQGRGWWNQSHSLLSLIWMDGLYTGQGCENRKLADNPPRNKPPWLPQAPWDGTVHRTMTTDDATSLSNNWRCQVQPKQDSWVTVQSGWSKLRFLINTFIYARWGEVLGWSKCR